MEIVMGLIGLGLIVFFAFNATRFFGEHLSGRMNLQDLRLHGKPHRTLQQNERDSLAEFAEGFGYLGSMAPSYEPLTDDVYRLKGEGKVVRYSISGANSETTTIDGVPVEIPYTLREVLCAQDNEAEVVLAKGHALVLSLNGYAIALPDSTQPAT
ncbi:hypothetical protein [Ectopseudomonas alcaliphila]|uniref:hypothetical protein n=1 Tax=Ectopseudomonas alcaliphila TaxID=101564 RepID=UPI00277F83E4|nr:MULTISPECIES: hypothetical protein [Pseudomonas]MDP9938187.1 hypothetical protein [Pseudomonas sp. 3400]MDR7010410.1 hypothetical protein [Pseudomonas alcaliphila]